METMELKDKKVGDFVKENIKTAHVFKKYGIDFCCGGGVSLERACRKENVSIDDLAADLLKLENTPSGSQNFDKWELDFLCDYIVNTHHAYVAESTPMILSYAQKVTNVHGHAHPPVIEIYRLFMDVANELAPHMKKEELVLFPYIKKLVKAKNEKAVPEKSHFGTIQNPISMMEAEHETAGNLLKEIAKLSNNYSVPEWGCNTFKALYAKLDEFEQDLHIHVHLENNILFPKATNLERVLAAK
ncbi:MAG TPA: iron-sulfur cluster repair di-iron protein [Bacteroidia bacterium]|nr:iron-sulfur cluster repair di-iron protein [Bacteroidia bacterium]